MSDTEEDKPMEVPMGEKEEEEEEKGEETSRMKEGQLSKVVEGDELSKVEEEEEVDYSPAIAPLSPKVLKQEENQVEVSSSPAFQCLDEVSL